MNNEWSIVRTGAVLIIGTALNTTANAQAADTASSARAKERVDRVAAEVAATQFIASDPATRGSLILDQAHGVLFDRRVSHSNGTHLGQPKRPETHAKHLAQLLSASLVDGDSALGCGGDENRCHLTPGGPTLVRLGRTIVRGDSAFTQATALLPPGSARSREPFHRVRLEVVLHRVGNQWRVVQDAGTVTRS